MGMPREPSEPRKSHFPLSQREFERQRFVVDIEPVIAVFPADLGKRCTESGFVRHSRPRDPFQALAWPS
jgi:hypothetical protein